VQRFPVAFATSVLIGWASATGALRAQGTGLQTSDLPKFRSVAGVDASPDGRKVAYGVEMRDRPGRPYSQLWIMDVVAQQAQRVGGEEDRGGSPLWSPDGKWLAYMGGHGEQAGLWVVRPDGSGATFLAPVTGTNTALPGQGAAVT
jgi:Tol biopolymer transport system component